MSALSRILERLKKPKGMFWVHSRVSVCALVLAHEGRLLLTCGGR